MAAQLAVSAQKQGRAERDTRFQIGHGEGVARWLADIAMTPVASPTAEGRWLDGLDLARPEAWDDAYRFFRLKGYPKNSLSPLVGCGLGGSGKGKAR